MDYFRFLDISMSTLNMFSFMLGMFVGGMMMRWRALAIVCFYLVILVLYFALKANHVWI
jgi:hypothetical protein